MAVSLCCSIDRTPLCIATVRTVALVFPDVRSFKNLLASACAVAFTVEAVLVADVVADGVVVVSLLADVVFVDVSFVVDVVFSPVWAKACCGCENKDTVVGAAIETISNPIAERRIFLFAIRII
jgi:hypothetical protein